MSFARRYHHLAGSLGDLCASLDLLDAGFLGFLTRLTVHRRQVVLCALAHAGETALVRHRTEGLEFLDAVATLVPVAKDLRRMRPRDLLAKHVGPFRDGLLGALGKVGPRVQDPEFYRDLARLFTASNPDPVHAEKAAIVRQLRRLDAERLAVVTTLAQEPALLTLRWAETLATATEAEDVVTATRLLREHAFERLDETAFAMSARETRCDPALFFEAWLAKGDKAVPPPIDLGAAFEPLCTTAHLAEVGSGLKVCLGSLDLCAQVLARRKFFWLCREHSMVVEADMVGGLRGARAPVPFLVGLHGVGNQPIPSSVRRRIESALARMGLPSLHAPPPASEFDVFFRLNTSGMGRTLDIDGAGDGEFATAEDVISGLKLAAGRAA